MFSEVYLIHNGIIKKNGRYRRFSVKKIQFNSLSLMYKFESNCETTILNFKFLMEKQG